MVNIQYRTSIFLFHRNLHLNDNLPLLHALKNSKEVILCFIFDPRQIGTQNTYRSIRAISFMHETLEDLEEQLSHRAQAHISFFKGKSEQILHKILRKHPQIDALYTTRDYTPFAQEREKHLTELCKQENRDFQIFDDLLINPPSAVRKQDSSPYTKFTPFYRTASAVPVAEPQKNHSHNYRKMRLPGAISLKECISGDIASKSISSLIGGREAAEKLLQSLPTRCAQYRTMRDFPAYDCTSRLSPHNKFTTYSPREFYDLIKRSAHDSESLLRQWYWRDFFSHIASHFPHIFGQSFHQKYDAIPWETSEELFSRWKDGTTGFPFVDAGMRQLNEIGWMHNRARLITASFLTKDLHIDWRMGERYFAHQLVDYDPAVNNGNWQWVAGTGCDSQPYFRIFNPWLQQKRFDPKAEYIKQWVPELRTFDAKTIHNWHRAYHAYKHHPYPPPIVDHATEAARSISLFKKIQKAS